MATLTIDLADDVRKMAQTRVAERGYPGIKEYLEALIVADAFPITPEIEAKLIEGLNSPSRVMTDADWDRKKRELAEWYERTHR